MIEHKDSQTFVAVVQLARVARLFKIAGLLNVALAIVCSTAPVATGQSPEADTESLTSWQYVAEVKLAKSDDAKLFDIVLSPSVFARARHNLADLRLYDSEGGAVPYKLRVRQKEDRTEPFNAKEFDRSQAGDGVSQVSFDLENENLHHNELTMSLSGDSFRRKAVLEGSNDRKNWQHLVTKNVIRFQSGGERINDQSLSYPLSRFRYLRLSVSQDPQVDERAVTIREVVVKHTVKLPGVPLTLVGKLGERMPYRQGNAHSSAWIIQLGGDNVPCDKLEVQVGDLEFVRDFVLEALGPADSDELRMIYNGQWQRRSGQEPRPLLVEFEEVRASRLRLIVIDYSNPPLNVESVKFSAPARQVVFAKPVDNGQGLRLFFGNPRAVEPRYDFAGNLPDKLDPPPTRCRLGQPQENPQYIPEPLPFTERWPWLIYLVLASVSIVLGYIIVNISRTAIAIHDREHDSDESEIDSASAT